MIKHVACAFPPINSNRSINLLSFAFKFKFVGRIGDPTMRTGNCFSIALSVVQNLHQTQPVQYHTGPNSKLVVRYQIASSTGLDAISTNGPARNAKHGAVPSSSSSPQTFAASWDGIGSVNANNGGASFSNANGVSTPPPGESTTKTI